MKEKTLTYVAAHLSEDMFDRFMTKVVFQKRSKSDLLREAIGEYLKNHPVSDDELDNYYRATGFAEIINASD